MLRLTEAPAAGGGGGGGGGEWGQPEGLFLVNRELLAARCIERSAPDGCCTEPTAAAGPPPPPPPALFAVDVAMQPVGAARSSPSPRPPRLPPPCGTHQRAHGDGCMRRGGRGGGRALLAGLVRSGAGGRAGRRGDRACRRAGRRPPAGGQPANGRAAGSDRAACSPSPGPLSFPSHTPPHTPTHPHDHNHNTARRHNSTPARKTAADGDCGRCRRLCGWCRCVAGC